MERIAHRYIIQYFYLKGLTPTNIKFELDSTLGESAPSLTIIKFWIGEFEKGNILVTTSDDMIIYERRQKVRELAARVGVSKSAVHRILTENLDLARWQNYE